MRKETHSEKYLPFTYAKPQKATQKHISIKKPRYNYMDRQIARAESYFNHVVGKKYTN